MAAVLGRGFMQARAVVQLLRPATGPTAAVCETRCRVFHPLRRYLSTDKRWEAALTIAEASIREVADSVSSSHVFIGGVQYFNSQRADDAENSREGMTRMVVCSFGSDNRGYFHAEDLIDTGTVYCLQLCVPAALNGSLELRTL